MYIIVPLIIIAGSVAIMAAIVWRKFPYLKKLPIDSASPEIGLWTGFFPEAGHYLKKIDFRLYRDLFYKELEKFLRRLRVVSLKLDTFTHHLIDKIRANGNGAVEHLTPKSESKEAEVPVVVIPVLSREEKQKKDEHALIIEIAKNPKTPELYKRLADIYILTENFADAAEALKTALKLDPEDKKTEIKLRAVEKALPM
ncbi:MAG: tetratricopeptide repeat protein [bacterium]|nr:tetratricopeptide repeat protein [bacterium]